MPWDYILEPFPSLNDPFTQSERLAWVCSRCNAECEEGVDVCGDCIAENIPEAYMTAEEVVNRPQSMFGEACAIVRAATALMMESARR